MRKEFRVRAFDFIAFLRVSAEHIAATPVGQKDLSAYIVEHNI
jgi:hypothetical protein